MQIQYFKPSGFLSQYIKYYWTLETDKADGDLTERVVPTGNVELMFHFKNSFRVKHCDTSVTQQPQNFISGISSTYSDVTTCGDAGMIAVTFYPFGACNFFRLPMHELAERKICLDDLCSADFRIIEQQLGEKRLLHEKIKIIEKFLLRRFFPVDKNDIGLLKAAISLIEHTRGQIYSNKLSEKLSISTKNLERKFSCLLGKSPKQFAKIVRFQHVLCGLSNYSADNLTHFAFDNGYYDQAHFIKDFKSFTGYTPGEYFSSPACVSDYFG
jgi:AraC-like DNA-binding protein